MKFTSKNKRRGFGLVETIIGVAVFALVSVSVFQGIATLLDGLKVVRLKQTATNLANEQFEIIRNMPYADVGIVGGIPDGKVPREKTITRDSTDFLVTTTIRNVDDPFDGLIGEVPNDLSPEDNKLVEVEIGCVNTCDIDNVIFTTKVAPKSLELVGNNGALFVQVLNSSGQPLVDADVHIENTNESPNLVIDETTDSNGMLQIVGAPPGVEAYEISVTKSGYSSEQTYTNGAPSNPNPDKPHATVATGAVTQISFTIDELSDLTIRTKRSNCSAVGSIDFNMYGSKTIGEDILKYDQNHTTSVSGLLSLSNVEWDVYDIDITDVSYNLEGSNPMIPLALNPGSDQTLDIIVSPVVSNAVLVRVTDGSTGLPLSGVTVTLDGETLITNQGFMTQTDWSGGSGQTEYVDETKYLLQDGNIEHILTPGQIELAQFAGDYISSGNLTSSTFDTGTTTNFHTLEWMPGSQPVEVGTDSVRFQVATSDDNTATTTWSFVGPNGGIGTYFTTPGESFHSSHNGDRYLRYKTYLQTVDIASTPTVSDVSFTISSECTPAGQVLFNGMSSGETVIEVSASGYQTFTNETFDITDPWQSIDVVLTP
ncbi:MAG: hypothetical protein ACI9GH_000525 [Candidatus Paceibacteria bacterium]|jgi:hypothetical protein